MNIDFYLDDHSNIGHALNYEDAKKLTTPYYWKSGRVVAHYLKDVYGVGTITATHDVNGLKDLKKLYEEEQ